MRCGDYTLVRAPPEYPGKKYDGKWCYEHQLVYWQTYGIITKNGEIIHHKNGNRRDNRVENLELITIGKHNIIHPKIQKRIPLFLCCCEYCGSIYFIQPRKYRYKKRRREHFLCSRKCIGKLIGGGRKNGVKRNRRDKFNTMG